MQNESGIQPLEFNVLIDQDPTDEKTKGGLLKPQDAIERDKHAQTRGTIVAISPMAFDDSIFPTEMERPKPGQRVAFARHAGVFVTGEDGKEYRVVKDKDVVALIG
jgi:co-chaperonin GroES (HSP10)